MKPILKVVGVVCLVLAVLITVAKNYSYIKGANSGGLDSLKRGQMIWTKCNNPECKAESQMDNKDYLAFMEKNIEPSKLLMTGVTITDFNEILKETPALVCSKCQKASVYKAFKCPKCELVFFSGIMRHDYPDRCPKCSFSKIEEDRKLASIEKSAGAKSDAEESKPEAVK